MNSSDRPRTDVSSVRTSLERPRVWKSKDELVERKLRQVDVVFRSCDEVDELTELGLERNLSRGRRRE